MLLVQKISRGLHLVNQSSILPDPRRAVQSEDGRTLCGRSHDNTTSPQKEVDNGKRTMSLSGAKTLVYHYAIGR